MASEEHDDVLSSTAEDVDAPIALPPPEPAEPHEFTEKEVGEYKETDRYLPVRLIFT